MRKKFLFTFESLDKTIYRVEGDSYEEISKSVHYSDRMLTITKL